MFSPDDNIESMEVDTQKIFVAGIRKLFEDKKRRMELEGKKFTWAQVATSVNLTPGNLSGFITFKRNYSEEKRAKLASFFKASYMEVMDIGRAVLKGEDPPDLLPGLTERVARLEAEVLTPDIEMQASSAPVDPIVLEHEKLIRQFPNPSKGLEISRQAAELAQINPEEIDEIIEYIKYRINKAKPKSSPKNEKTGTDDEGEN